MNSRQVWTYLIHHCVTVILRLSSYADRLIPIGGTNRLGARSVGPYTLEASVSTRSGTNIIVNYIYTTTTTTIFCTRLIRSILLNLNILNICLIFYYWPLICAQDRQSNVYGMLVWNVYCVLWLHGEWLSPPAPMLKRLANWMTIKAEHCQQLTSDIRRMDWDECLCVHTHEHTSSQIRI